MTGAFFASSAMAQRDPLPPSLDERTAAPIR
jgi:hypothetical protein